MFELYFFEIKIVIFRVWLVRLCFGLIQRHYQISSVALGVLLLVVDCCVSYHCRIRTGDGLASWPMWITGRGRLISLLRWLIVCAVGRPVLA